jgi:type IV fimbrial biogenesis protein FimT
MRKTQHGFTLPELLTAIAIVGILAAITVPTLRQFSANTRTAAANNSLISALAIARSEALRRSTPVTVCSSADAATCANSTNWATGWIAYADVNANGAFDAASDQLLQAWSAPSGNVSVSSTANLLTYNTRGMMNLGAAITFKTWVQGCRGLNQTQVVVTVGGSPQNTHIACP